MTNLYSFQVCFGLHSTSTELILSLKLHKKSNLRLKIQLCASSTSAFNAAASQQTSVGHDEHRVFQFNFLPNLFGTFRPMSDLPSIAGARINFTVVRSCIKTLLPASTFNKPTICLLMSFVRTYYVRQSIYVRRVSAKPNRIGMRPD